MLAQPAMRAAAKRTTGRWGSLTILASLGFLVYYGGTMLGIVRIGAAATGIIVGLLPCLTFLIGVLAYGDRLRAAKLAGLVLAVGAAVAYGLRHSDPVAMPGAGPATAVAGVLCALVGTISYALYGYAYRRRMGDVPSLASLPGITGMATLLLLPAAALAPGGLRLPVDQLPGLIFLGVVFTAPVFLVSHELFLLCGPPVHQLRRGLRAVPHPAHPVGARRRGILQLR